MLIKLFKSTVFALLIPLLAMATGSTVPPNSVVLTVNGNGDILTMYNSSWSNPGSLNQNYLDFAHTQKTWNNIDLEPGTYKWTVQLQRRNNKQGKVNFDVKVKYMNGSTEQPVNVKLESNRTSSNTFGLPDYKSKSSGSAAGYGRVKVHIGRNGANTNCNYNIVLTKVGDPPVIDPPTPPAYPGITTGSGNGISGTSGTSGSTSSNSGCTYSSLGSKSGNVIFNTLGKIKSSKKACKNLVTAKVTKTGGKARTTMMVYKSSSRNGTGTLVQSVEFPKGSSKYTKEIRVNNANGKFIRIELKNRSAGKTFKYKAYITQ